MSKKKLLLISLLGSIIFLGAGVVLAQDATQLEITEPTLLPDSPFYFLKNISRAIQETFTFGPIAKAELKLKFANERIIEVGKLAEKNKDSKIIEEGIKKFGEEMESIKENVDRIKEKTKDSEKVEKFLDKFIKQEILHQKILEKLEAKVPEAALEKIKEARERHLERFGQVMTKLEDRQKELAEKIDESLKELKGDDFEEFKNLEVLKRIEEKIPESAKEAIQKAQENSLKRLQTKIEQMSPEQQEKFENYIKDAGGDKEKQIEIIENLRGELKTLPAVREKLLKTREKILNQIEIKSCPIIEKPNSDFCKDGRVTVKKNDQGCVIAFNCLIPGEFNTPPSLDKLACITLWDPVCGKNNRTYSNKCFARAAGIEIASPGECGVER